ncbi:MAG: hypothetical protein JST84_28265 [Acidobacteria bacterium]|nr:hypothetical protein [Acidobacteriota bacterium]
MAEITTVEITHGSVTARLEIEYRWYAPGNDPWHRTAGGINSIPAAGDWENRAISGSTSNVRMMSSSGEHFMTLLNFRRVTVGSTGQGEFYASGYLIPEYSTVNWRVLSVRG